MTIRTLLVLPVISDFYGGPLGEDGPIGLTRISINRSHWKAHMPEASFIIRDGDRLIIKREGNTVLVQREIDE